MDNFSVTPVSLHVTYTVGVLAYCLGVRVDASPFSLFDPFNVLFVLESMKYSWLDYGFSLSLCTIIGSGPVVSSHLNSGYWARLSVTSDFFDSLAAMCYELIRGGHYICRLCSMVAFSSINISNQNECGSHEIL